MHLEIITPEQTLFSGDVDSVTVPGAKGSFAVLKNHAPIVSSLNKGIIKYKSGEAENSLTIPGGFIKVSHNKITICLTSNACSE